MYPPSKSFTLPRGTSLHTLETNAVNTISIKPLKDFSFKLNDNMRVRSTSKIIHLLL